MSVQVAIIGAGPAGLLLSHLLHLFGVSSVVLETRDRAYIEARVRAGILEHGTADILRQAGLGARMDAEGLAHKGIELRFGGASHRIAMTDYTDRTVMLYGQQEVVKDLVARRLADGGDVRFGVSDVRIGGIDTRTPSVHFTHEGRRTELAVDVVVGADGFHGVSRPAAGDALTSFERVYPFGWLGILAHAEPRVDELVYALHDRGFALYSMRSPRVSRLYLQVPITDTLDQWPDERIWDELAARFSLDGEPWEPNRGEIFERSIAPLRSFVVEPMQRGRLLLAGDSAHIVPPTGAKGLNLAVHDVWLLARALDSLFTQGNEDLLTSYSADALARVWRAEQFSYWMTTMLHRMNDDPFAHRLQLAQLDNVVASRAYATALAENYVG